MRRIAFLLVLTFAAGAVGAAEDPRAADHQALRDLLTATSTALNARDVDAVGRLLAPDATLTFIDQVEVRDAAGVTAYFARWFGPDSALQSVRFAPEAERLATFLGDDVAIARGHSDDLYTMKDGRSGVMRATWTATAVRRDGAWRIAALHAGVDPVANAYLDMQQATWKRIMLFAGLGGVAVGVALALILRRKPAAPLT